MKTKTPQNILVVSLSNIGDVILTLPVINVLRGNFPEASISIVIGPKVKELLDENDQLKQVFIYDKKAPFDEKVQFILNLRKERFDTVVDLRNTLIPYLVGTKQFNFSPLFKKTRGPMREKHLSQLSFLSVNPAEQKKLPLFTTSDEESLIQKLQDRGITLSGTSYYVVSPGARAKDKTWPTHLYGILCKQILDDDLESPVFLVGSEEEKEYAQSVLEVAEEGVHDLIGALTLKESACLISSAKALISNDSAAMHLGHYELVPTVAIFGPTDPKLYGRIDSKSRVVAPLAGETIQGIDVERVKKELQNLLK